MRRDMCIISRDASGQVLLLTALAIGGTILGATTIAGLLMTYQIRQATDFANSAKAVFAADGAAEWALYNLLCEDKSPCPLDPPSYLADVKSVAQCFDSRGAPLPACDDIGSTYSIRAVGTAPASARVNVSRAFLVNISR